LGLANGLGWLTVGVGFSCPQCKTWAVFPSGDPSMTVNGKSVLLVGATANCGAVLLPAQSLFVKGELKSTALKESSAQSDIYDHQFEIKNRYGYVEKNYLYTLKSFFGEPKKFISDELGRTIRHSTDDAKFLEIHKGHN
jgi:hypothetical protein